MVFFFDVFDHFSYVLRPVFCTHEQCVRSVYHDEIIYAECGDEPIVSVDD